MNSDKKLTAATLPAQADSWSEEAELTGRRKWIMPILVTGISIFAVYSVWTKLAKAEGNGPKSAESVQPFDVFPDKPKPIPTPEPKKPIEDIREKPVETPIDTPPPPSGPTSLNPKGPGPITLPNGPGNNLPWRPRIIGPVITQAEKEFGMDVAKTIEDALRRHPIAKTAAGIAPKVRAAVSPDGRITGLVLESSTGNPTLDKIISEELTNLRTPSIAPEGTKFITVRISLRRPN